MGCVLITHAMTKHCNTETFYDSLHFLKCEKEYKEQMWIQSIAYIPQHEI